MNLNLTRRQMLTGLCAGAAGLASRPLRADPAALPVAPVALARCRSYGAEVYPTLKTMFDQLGGLGRIANGKTVAIKINMTEVATWRFGHMSQEETFWAHPAVIAATVALLDQAGARRIRIVEGAMSTADPLEEFMLAAGWDPREFSSLAPRVEFENTNFLGYGKAYHRVQVPRGGLLFPAYDLNHSYVDCDSFLSITKMKEHGTAGITLSMKNSFGITPCTVYGDAGAGKDEPVLVPNGGRGTVFHRGNLPPALTAPQENDPSSPRDGGYRVPRSAAELAAARPVDLAIVDAVHTIGASEIPSSLAFPISPGLLLAGTNPVCLDSVGASVMGFDPMADRGTAPFENCDNTMRLGEELGIGSRDLARIEVIGERPSEVVCDFRAERKARGIPTPTEMRQRWRRPGPAGAERASKAGRPAASRIPYDGVRGGLGWRPTRSGFLRTCRASSSWTRPASTATPAASSRRTYLLLRTTTRSSKSSPPRRLPSGPPCRLCSPAPPALSGPFMPIAQPKWRTDFPMPLDAGVYYNGFTSRNSFGASSYFLETPERELAYRFAPLGGPAGAPVQSTRRDSEHLPEPSR